MTDKELDEIIKRFEEMSSQEDAYFDSSYNEDFGYAKGNRDGLILYATEFLKAARAIENRKFEQGGYLGSNCASDFGRLVPGISVQFVPLLADGVNL